MKIPDVIIDAAVSMILPSVIKSAKSGYPPEKLFDVCKQACIPVGKKINDGCDAAVKNGEVIENPFQEYFDAAIDGAQEGIRIGCDMDEV